MVQQLRKLFQNHIYSDWERSRLAIHTSHVIVFVLLLLRARKRPLAVLIADWRGFQQLAESLPAEKVALIMKSFYNKSYEIQRNLGLDDASRPH
jgi:class 3 adenylate cyclase